MRIRNGFEVLCTYVEKTELTRPLWTVLEVFLGLKIKVPKAFKSLGLCHNYSH